MGQSYKKWMRTAWGAGGVVLAVGCAAPAHTITREAPSAQTQRQPQSAPDKRSVIAPELASILRVVRVRMSDRAGYLNIQVFVQNLTDAPQNFSYRLDWFDKDGGLMHLGTDNFIPWMLTPREVSTITATAPSPMAADFGIAFVPTLK